jgi:hypothetical protein
MALCEIKLFKPEVAECAAAPDDVHRHERQSVIVWLCNDHKAALDEASDS